LPAALDPDVGFLISANNHPLKTEPPISAGGNSNDRYARMARLIEQGSPLAIEDLRSIQRDVHLPSGLAAAQALVELAPEDRHAEFRALVAEWDGDFDRDSKGAPAYRRWAFELLAGPYTERLGESFTDAWKGSVGLHERLLADLQSGWLSADDVAAALDRAAEEHDPEQTWGAVHRLPLRHPLGAIPWLGRGYRWGELEGDGTLGTVRKTAGPFTPDEHESFFGAQARHLHDLSDPDANYFVLLGGQDGWIGSANLIDQVELWESGEFIQMPLRRPAIEAGFTRALTLTPRAGE
jgi:penicillin amidase